MVRPGGGQGAGGSSGEEDKDAKHMFDRIGKKVHDQVKNGEAKTFKDELKGDLSEATFKNGNEIESGKAELCKLNHIYHTNVTIGGGREYPCRKGTEKRFSEVHGGECANSKIKGNKGKEDNSEGACAPYRRLHLCDRNLEHIDPEKITSTHNLLVDVLLGAQYEGQSIIQDYPKYQATYGDSGFTMCTMLARSFADIGDIIRGRDLYRRDNKKDKTDKLQEQLKKYFQKIYEGLTSTNGRNGEAAKERYNDATGNFFQLREDWWDANRETVWKAITCNAGGYSYFRATCGDDKENTATRAKDKCRCEGASIVPTYFDYVPQFLRWFEEWAEDFCRKKKKKVENLQKQCRGQNDSGEPRYCSRNGYDCTKTKPAIGKYRMGNQCTKCLFACNPYVEWIDNQRKQFDKQKKKYDKEIKKYINEASSSSAGRAKRAASTTNYEGYEKKFYEKLKDTNYKNVEDFLKKLNDEDICRKIDDEEGGKIDFKNVNSGKHSSGGTSGASGTNDASQGTFYRSKYCQPCPHCGMKKKDDGSGGWEPKREDEKCKRGNLYKPKPGATPTEITILKSGEGETEIKEKLEAFCAEKNGGVNSAGGGGGVGSGGGGNSDSSLYDPWKCYNDVEKVNNGQEDEDDEEDVDKVKKAGGLCILENKNKKSADEPAEFQKTFNPFFYYWVAHMLKDSIYWETQKLEKCLKNKSKKCGNQQCKDDCGCFQKWVGQKRKEWGKIVQHFNTQEGFGEQVGQGIPHYIILEGVLQLEFSKENSAEDAENNVSAREIDLINEMLKEDEKEQEAADVADNENNTTIDKLLDHEEKEAKQCKQKQDECNQQKQQQQQKQPTGGPGRAAVPSRDSPLPPAGDRGPGGRSDSSLPPDGPSPPDHSEDLDDDGDEDEEEEEDDDDDQETKVEEPVSPPAQDDVNVCNIVNNVFTDGTTLQAACPTKYGKNAPTSWKCISETTTTSGATTTGGLCIPPRRRKLYIGKIKEWAGITVNGDSSESTDSASKQAQQSAEANGASTTATTNELPEASLRRAFVESAAVETFFLWHKYKAENTKRQSGGAGGLLPINGTLENSGEETPENQLKNGTIPEEFKRQMFYTLGDYKDILFSGDKDEKNGYNDIVSGDNVIKERESKIKKAIQEFFEQNSNKAGGPPQKNATENPESWWEQHGKHIWHGMICALTYKETGEKGTPLKQDDGLKDALWDDTNNKPKKEEYQYDKVKLDENSGDGPKPQSTSTSGDDPINNPKLSDFVLRPPYFRYLEEWGETFCKERTKRLEKIEEECMDEDGTKQKYSGDGEECSEIVENKDKIFKDLEKPSCATSCRSYKKWIERKKDEYDEQKSAYNQEKKDATTKSGDISDQYFVKNLLNGYSSIDSFLDMLKNGPCKTDNKKYEIDFKEPGKTFRNATNCGTCSEFTVKCNGNGKCSGDGTKVKCTGRTIFAKDIETIGNPTEDIGMLVSDNSGNGFNDLQPCKNAGIFKSIRKDEWKCGKVCGIDVCALKKDNGSIDDKQIILIRALLKRWLEYFFEDYNRIQKKLNLCIENGKGSTCIKKCVDKWVEEKKNEWDKINEKYIQVYTQNNDAESNNLTNFLETLIPRIALTNGKGKINELKDFLRLYECKCAANSTSEDSKKNDVIDCLLDRLKTKATSCKEKHQNSEETQPNDENPAQCQESPSVEDDDDPLEEDEQNPVGNEKVGNKAPAFCPAPVEDKKKEEEGDDCKPAAAPSEKQTNQTSNPEQTPVLKPEEEKAPAPRTPPSTPATPAADHPQADEPTNSIGDILSSTIPFGIAIALTSIVGKHDSYSGIDLINDSLSGDYDIYDELLKRKENELFGTEHHPKRTSIHSVAKNTNSDPIHNQLELFHKWLDRHRDMCEKWNNKEELLDKLKEEWENKTHSGNIHPSDSNKTLNTDVSIQIHMDNPKPINEFTYVDSNPNQVDDTYVDSNPDNSSMDTILEDLDKPFNEPYYYDMYDDDMYYDVHDHDASTVDSNNMDVPSKVQIEMDVNTKLVKEKYPIADVWDI
ncbi:hypothetical protein PFNF135_05463 [Plasmodium falciparum NF135/5.C10]|uniref:Duffy-binding-like domain-containing protein n=1 Tax=Plasmodium falciparum NF135/5.C10 TaxID=1036726 RepID=W4IAT3_PLAFA|nr:hypothetical protein PFNF135_05463 [Plasmodium falciparum NF135/5.C10]